MQLNFCVRNGNRWTLHVKKTNFSAVNGLVGSSGLEPPTSRLSGARSNHLSYEPVSLSAASVFFGFLFLCPFYGLGGDDGIRTHDPLLAGQVLSQLSYTPIALLLLFSFPVTVSSGILKIEQCLLYFPLPSIDLFRVEQPLFFTP